MKKLVGSLVMFLLGWKLDNSIDLRKYPKCVLIAAPHTSNWDFVIAVASFWRMGIPMRLFIKDSWTKPWYGFIIKSLGGIGVNREQRTNMTGYAANLLKNADHLYLLNTPEGTRSRVEKWKKGFYYIAREADVPVLCSYGDYKLKKAGIGRAVEVTNKTPEQVLQEIQDFYEGIHAKYPEKYNPQIY